MLLVRTNLKTIAPICSKQSCVHITEKMKQIAQREDEERRRQEEIQRAKEAEEGIESEQTAPQPDDVAAPEVVAEKPQTAEEKEERPEANNEENEEEDEEAAEEVVEEPKHTLTSAEAKQRQVRSQHFNKRRYHLIHQCFTSYRYKRKS